MGSREYEKGGPSPPPTIPGYEILEPIGRGGMGEVFLARQQNLARKVAVKVLAHGFEQGADAARRLARFRREAELMARVSHPNVLAVFDCGVVDDRPYLVMEYVEGGDLRRRLEPGRPLPVAAVVAILRPVAEALACLHRNGILHRDLKPENILMHDEGNPKVADFGIAVLRPVGTTPPTATGQGLGTLGYAAPEQQYRLQVDERADQYSFAALAYEMLTGVRALGAIRPPSRYHRGLRPAADAVILRALQEDPDDRYATLGEFADRLFAAIGPPRPSRWTRGVAVVAVAATVAGGGLAVSAWWGWPGETDLATGRRKLEGSPRPPPPPVPRPEVGPPAIAPRDVDDRPDLPPTIRTRTLGIELVRIPAGSFVPVPPPGRAHDPPRRPVPVPWTYYLGRHEVTREQFAGFVAATGYVTDAERDEERPGGWVYAGPPVERKRWEPSASWKRPFLAAELEGQPAVLVSARDAEAFCGWLSREEGRTYRLPSEAMWEHACWANGQGPGPWGARPGPLGGYGWSTADAEGHPHPVGRKAPTAFGLFDLLGNVAEWCRAATPRGGPGDERKGPQPKGRGKGGRPGPEKKKPAGEPIAYVLRGGSWATSPTSMEPPARLHAARPEARATNAGFRIAYLPRRPGPKEGPP